MYVAWGFAGQFVFCVAGLQLVVATNAFSSVDWQHADQQKRAILDWIVSELLPAITDRTRRPRRTTGRVRAAEIPRQLPLPEDVLSPVAESASTVGG